LSLWEKFHAESAKVLPECVCVPVFVFLVVFVGKVSRRVEKIQAKPQIRKDDNQRLT